MAAWCPNFDDRWLYDGKANAWSGYNSTVMIHSIISLMMDEGSGNLDNSSGWI